MKHTFFLHWGPGGNAQFERVHFSNTAQTKNILWWDQPAGTSPSLNKVLEASSAQLLAQHENTKEKIALLGHSFGGWAAIHLANRHPDLVSSVTLLGTCTSPSLGFVALAKRVLEANPANEGFGSSIVNFEAAPASLDAFGQMMGEMVQIPTFREHYWAPESKAIMEDFFAAPHPPLDPQTFFALMKDVLESGFPAPKLSVPASIPTRVILGTSDPFHRRLDSETEWKKTVPHCEVIWTKKAGHFVHLETDPANWCPA